MATVVPAAWVARSNERTRLVRAHETQARPPAKTTSAGSVSHGRVSVTTPAATETTETELESWFTTHASSFETALTETGSSPPAISRMSTGAGLVGLDTSKTERRASGVFTTKSRVPSGERQTGRACCASKFV